MIGRLGWLFHQTIIRFTKNDGNLLATSMAYYAAFSFFPLLLILMSALGYALQFSENAQNEQQELLELLSQSTAPALATQIETILAQVKTRAAWNNVIGSVTLLLGSIGIFSQLESTFDKIWHQATPHDHGMWAAVKNALWNRLKAFLTLLTLGALVVAALIANFMLTAAQTWAEELPGGHGLWQLTQLGFSVGLNAFVFTLVYRLVPRVPVRWKHAAAGGLTIAILWQFGSQLVARFIVGGNYSAYGVVGSFIAMMLWVYWASLLLFMGAQLVQVLGYPQDPDGIVPGTAAKSKNGAGT